MEHVKCCIWALRRPLAAFATSSFYILKCCNPIGQFHRLPVASVGLLFFSKKLDVDLPLGEKIVPGKFHQNWSYGVETHSEQTNRQTFFFIYIDSPGWHLIPFWCWTCSMVSCRSDCSYTMHTRQTPQKGSGGLWFCFFRVGKRTEIKSSANEQVIHMNKKRTLFYLFCYNNDATLLGCQKCFSRGVAS